MFNKETAQEVFEKLLRDEFIYQLKQDSRLTIETASGVSILSTAVTMDRKRNSLIIAEKSPNGQIILESNDPVTILTQANRDHDVYSFHSKVSNIILDNGDILYEIVIPKRLQKGQRRKTFRINLDTASQVKMKDSVYEGHVSNVSSAGMLLAIDGYWPEAVEDEGGNAFVQCDVAMDFMTFNCNLNIRFINFEPYPSRRTFIGGQLRNLQPQHQHRLDNYLSMQQRIEQRRKAELKI